MAMTGAKEILTYFGSQFHGYDVVWTHDPTASTKYLYVTQTLNWYSSAVFVDARDSGKIDMTGIAQGIQAGLTVKEYELRMSLVFSLTNATDGTIQCSNTNATGTSVCYDGLQAYFKCDSVRELAAYNTFSNEGVASTAASDASNVWNSVNCYIKALSTTAAMDLKPGSATDNVTMDTDGSGTMSYADWEILPVAATTTFTTTAPTIVHQDEYTLGLDDVAMGTAAEIDHTPCTGTIVTTYNVQPCTGTTNDYCSEKWFVNASLNQVACVQIKMTMRRLWTTTDVEQDLQFDYIAYNVYAAAGKSAEMKTFTTQEVDFALFNAADTTTGAIAGMAAGAAATAMAFALL